MTAKYQKREGTSLGNEVPFFTSKSVSFAICKKSCTFAQNFENNLYVD